MGKSKATETAAEAEGVAPVAAEAQTASTFVAEGSASEVAMALLSGDDATRAAMVAKVESELAAAQLQAEAAAKRIARCNEVLANFAVGPAPSAPVSMPRRPRQGSAPAAGRGRGAPAASGDASAKEVLSALAQAGKSGMSLGALRSACGGQRTKTAVDSLVESGKLFFPENQQTRGAGLVVRAK